MDSRILYLDTLTEPIVRLRIVFVYIIVTMDKECSKTSFAFAIRRFITCLIVHGLHITLPAVTHITAVYHLFIRPSTSASSTTIRLKETIITYGTRLVILVDVWSIFNILSQMPSCEAISLP